MFNKNFLAISCLLLICFVSIHYTQTTNFGFYYVSGSGEHGIYLAEKDQLGNWKRGKKILLDGQFNGNAVDPDVIKLDDGRYRLFYYKGYFVTPPPPNYTVHEIYSAVSNDGVNFTVEGKVFESDNITDPTVIKLNDGTYLMACVRGSLDIFAKSLDGKNFQATGVTIQNGGIPELVKLDDGSIRLFYNGPGGIISSRSTDGGLTWTKENGARLSFSGGIADPSVIKRADGKWYLFVKGFNNTGAQNPAGHNVRLSESNDCYTFNFINGVLLDSASVPDGVVLNPSTDVLEKNEKILPNDFILYQNYPNPFNPETTISWQLAVNSYVTLKIYDVLGREISTLVNETQHVGIHNSKFITQNSTLPSGIYYYKLSVNGFSQTKKMVLLK
ncbi:MAG: T9SS type A sorting domain-containing protein [Ignavibacteriales bacterium]|nr:T9SS type A sorting domain-containing protein [Ignavibacteriales bacterium]